MRFRKTTLSKLAGRPIQDELTLNLADAAAYVATEDVDGGTTRYTVILGQSLGRRALMDLLYTVAPYKAHGPDRFSRVLDNWRLHDRAKTSTGSESLLLQHERSLKSNWRVFAAHRELFISVFEDATESTRVVPVMIWDKNRDGARRWQLDTLDQGSNRYLDAPGAESLEQVAAQAKLDSLVGLVTIPYLFPELRRNWKQWQPLVKGGKSNYIGPASAPMISLQHRRSLLNSPFVLRTEEYVGES